MRSADRTSLRLISKSRSGWASYEASVVCTNEPGRGLVHAALLEDDPLLGVQDLGISTNASTENELELRELRRLSSRGVEFVAAVLEDALEVRRGLSVAQVHGVERTPGVP